MSANYGAGIPDRGCTCTMTLPPKGWESYNGPEPAEWEQNPWCPVHPDPQNQTARPPRFVPFESMSDAEQREHLRRMPMRYTRQLECTFCPGALILGQAGMDEHWRTVHGHTHPRQARPATRGEPMTMLSDEELADIRDARRMLARFESEMGGFDIAPMTVRGLLAHIDALTAEITDRDSVIERLTGDVEDVHRERLRDHEQAATVQAELLARVGEMVGQRDAAREMVVALTSGHGDEQDVTDENRLPIEERTLDALLGFRVTNDRALMPEGYAGEMAGRIDYRLRPDGTPA